MIRLYDSTETSFVSNGKGNLSDPISCVVTEERNGTFEVELEYPIDGLHYNDMALRDLIFCKPNPFSEEEPFRIYRISKPINGVVTINAAHISYDLSGILMPPFTAEGIGNVFQQFESNSITTHNFKFSTDKDSASVTNKYTKATPNSIRAMLGGSEGSILDIYSGGEYKFEKFNVYLKNNRGTDRGVTIRYGKNLTDVKQEENCADVCTGIYPFWYNENDGIVQLSEKVLNASGTYNFERIKTVDFSSYFSEKPTEDQLRARANTYLTNNKIGVPKVSLDVSFVQLEQSEEYETLQLLESVYLCDTVTVVFEDLGVSSTAKCITTNYNVITDKYISIELGDSVSNLSTSLNDLTNDVTSQNERINNFPTTSYMEKIIDEQTKAITGNKGGYVVLHDTNNDTKPDEILIMNDEEINTATRVWRWNKEGLGFSSKGYNGPYEEFAVTSDGTLHATNVKAEGIEAGTIEAKLDIIAPYIASSTTNPSFSLTGSTGVIVGSKIMNNANESLATCKLDGTGLRVGSQTGYGGAKGYLTVGADGWIRGSSSVDSGPAMEIGGICKGGEDPYYGSSNGALYGSRYISASLAGSYISSYVYDIVSAFNINSDERIKKNIKDLDENRSLSFIKDIRTVEFDYKEDPVYKKRHFGVIAQDVIPKLESNGYEADNYWLVRESMGDYYRVEYIEFIPHLINCIKAQQKQIDELKVRLDEIQNGGK